MNTNSNYFSNCRAVIESQSIIFSNFIFMNGYFIFPFFIYKVANDIQYIYFSIYKYVIDSQYITYIYIFMSFSKFFVYLYRCD